MIRTRFAPSPTGWLHIGSVRTALFSWLYARNQQGVFMLRLEDTDRNRSTAEAERDILQAIQWLGLVSDEPCVRQSERMELYHAVIRSLLEAGHAYRCYCSPEELESMRRKAQERGLKPRYDGRCRNRRQAPPPNAGSFVVRFRTPENGQVCINDQVQGKVIYQNSELDDLIIARSDGSPTYNLTAVADDRDMKISHVIRGSDLLNNTPRQIHIFEALGAKPPCYAHVPLIQAADGTRLSKRNGAASVLQYRDQGYLPEAMLNYLARLGWSWKDQELFSVDELIRHFGLQRVNQAAACFDAEKLLWCNQQHLLRKSTAELAKLLRPRLEKLGVDSAAGPDLAYLVQVQRTRQATLEKIAEASLVYYRAPESYQAKAAGKFLRKEAIVPLQELHERLAALPDWQEADIYREVQAVATEQKLAMSQVAQPLRVVLCGKAASPPIEVTLSLMGKVRALQRIRHGISFIQDSASRDRVVPGSASS